MVMNVKFSSDGMNVNPIDIQQTHEHYTHRIENTYNVDQIAGLSGTDQYHGAVFFDPFIFLIPDNADNVGVIDTVKKTIDTTSIPAPAGSRKWGGGMVAWNKKAYFIPQDFDAIGILDMRNFTLDTITMPGVFAQAFYGGFVAPNNGMLYSPPYNASTTLKINPFEDTFSTFGVYPGGPQKCQSAVLSSYDGMGYGVPRTQAEYIPIINPFNDTVDTTTITGLVGSNKWAGGAEGSDFKLYFAPLQHNSVAIVDPVTKTVDLVTITGFTGYSGACLMPNEKIYFAPKAANNVLIVDVPTQTGDNTTISGLTGADKFEGIVASRTGEAFTVANDASYSLVLQAGLPSISLDWCVSAYDNKY